MLKSSIIITLFFGYFIYGQAPAINKNVSNNSFRVETWGSLGNEKVIENYEIAKTKTKDKSQLKDLVLDAIYKNEQEKKALDNMFSEKEMSANKIKNQQNKITDKESSKYKKLSDKLDLENKELASLGNRLVKNMQDSQKLQEEYYKITEN